MMNAVEVIEKLAVKWELLLNMAEKSLITAQRYALSAVFAVARCLFVRLSVTLVDCIHTAEDIVKLFVRPGSPIILVFDPQRRYPIPREPLLRGTKYTGWENFAIFD